MNQHIQAYIQTHYDLTPAKAEAWVSKRKEDIAALTKATLDHLAELDGLTLRPAAAAEIARTTKARALAEHVNQNLSPVRCGIEKIPSEGPNCRGIYSTVDSGSGWSDPFHDRLRRPDAPWRWLAYAVDSTGYSAATLVEILNEAKAEEYVRACIREEAFGRAIEEEIERRNAFWESL